MTTADDSAITSVATARVAPAAAKPAAVPNDLKVVANEPANLANFTKDFRKNTTFLVSFQ